MQFKKDISEFLQNYPEGVIETVSRLQIILNEELPGVTEHLDISARMIAYCYGTRYIDMVCSVFPSQKGVKLGFYKGADLPDPGNVLRGEAKTTRYLEIKNAGDIDTAVLKQLLREALGMYRERVKSKT